MLRQGNPAAGALQLEGFILETVEVQLFVFVVSTVIGTTQEGGHGRYTLAADARIFSAIAPHLTVESALPCFLGLVVDLVFHLHHIAATSKGVALADGHAIL